MGQGVRAFETQDPRRGVAITLPDGGVTSFDGPVSGDEIAAAIGPGRAKATIATRFDGVMKDKIECVAACHSG